MPSFEDYVQGYPRGGPVQGGMLITVKPGETIQANSMGIEWIRIEVGGLIFKYRVVVKTYESVGLKFVDEEPDYYRLSCFVNGTHYVDYNSRGPTIRFIGVEKAPANLLRSALEGSEIAREVYRVSEMYQYFSGGEQSSTNSG